VTVRIGLFGTGHWAEEVHAPALLAAPEVELVGVWGRDTARTASFADRLGCRPYAAVDDLVADVDAVDVALPPDVQASVAVDATAAGRHLLLDKPLALTSRPRTTSSPPPVPPASRAPWVHQRFVPSIERWLQDRSGEDWHGAEAEATWLGSVFKPSGAGPGAAGPLTEPAPAGTVLAAAVSRGRGG
jgi:hypothetical protein